MIVTCDGGALRFEAGDVSTCNAAISGKQDQAEQ